MSDPVDAFITYGAAWALGLSVLTVIGYFFLWVLHFRFAEWKARTMAIALTASISLPHLIPGTLYFALAGAGAVMVWICVAKPLRDGERS